MKYVFIEQHQAEFSIKAMCRVLRRQGLHAKVSPRFSPVSYREHGLRVSENLLKQDFYSSGPNQKWSGDITYLRTDEGWLYLAVVIELWSRAVIGWSMSSRMTAQLACDALLKRHNLRGSMSTRGNCYDNACTESFFHTLKVECIHGERFTSRKIIQTTIFNYIECDFNRWCRHSTCGGLSPEQFENQTLA